MTTILFLKCFIAGLLGILFHVFVIKLPSLKKQAKAANLPFSVRAYFQDDWIALCSSVLTVCIGVFLLDEMVNFKPVILEYIKYFFIAIGFMGSSVLQAVLGRTSKGIMNVVDEKTNIADAVTGEGTASKNGR